MQPFDQVVSEHGVTVLRVCRAVLGPVDADDAWSETFLAALRSYPDLPADANVRGWLVTIAHRKAIDQIRARSRRPVPTDLPDRPAPPDATTDPDLADAIRGLPDKQRIAVAYHYLAGLPYADLAELTGQTTAAARRAAADGIKRLRTTFPELRGTDDDRNRDAGPTAAATGRGRGAGGAARRRLPHRGQPARPAADRRD